MSARPFVDENHLNPVLKVVTWLLLALMLLALSFRFLTRLFLKEIRQLRSDEILIILAFVCYHLDLDLNILNEAHSGARRQSISHGALTRGRNMGNLNERDPAQFYPAWPQGRMKS